MSIAVRDPGLHSVHRTRAQARSRSRPSLDRQDSLTHDFAGFERAVRVGCLLDTSRKARRRTRHEPQGSSAGWTDWLGRADRSGAGQTGHALPSRRTQGGDLHTIPPSPRRVCEDRALSSDRRARGDRRLAHGGSRQHRGNDRLVLRAAVRCAERFRRAARCGPRRPFRAAPGGAGLGHQAALLARHEPADHTLPHPARRRRGAGLHADRRTARRRQTSPADPSRRGRPRTNPIRARLRSAV